LTTTSRATINVPTASEFRDAFVGDGNESLINSFILLFIYVQSIQASDPPFSGTIDSGATPNIVVQNGIITGAS
jgi:hypothetical protein